MGLEQLGVVGAITAKPLLRKDFIFDPYQVWQARAHGADAILLMANILTAEGLRELSALAASLGVSLCASNIDDYFLDILLNVGINVTLAVSLNLVAMREGT